MSDNDGFLKRIGAKLAPAKEKIYACAGSIKDGLTSRFSRDTEHQGEEEPYEGLSGEQARYFREQLSELSIGAHADDGEPYDFVGFTDSGFNSLLEQCSEEKRERLKIAYENTKDYDPDFDDFDDVHDNDSNPEASSEPVSEDYDGDTVGEETSGDGPTTTQPRNDERDDYNSDEEGNTIVPPGGNTALTRTQEIVEDVKKMAPYVLLAGVVTGATGYAIGNMGDDDDNDNKGEFTQADLDDAKEQAATSAVDDYKNGTEHQEALNLSGTQAVQDYQDSPANQDAHNLTGEQAVTEFKTSEEYTLALENAHGEGSAAAWIKAGKLLDDKNLTLEQLTYQMTNIKVGDETYNLSGFVDYASALSNSLDQAVEDLEQATENMTIAVDGKQMNITAIRDLAYGLNNTLTSTIAQSTEKITALENSWAIDNLTTEAAVTSRLSVLNSSLDNETYSQLLETMNNTTNLEKLEIMDTYFNNTVNNLKNITTNLTTEVAYLEDLTEQTSNTLALFNTETIQQDISEHNSDVALAKLSMLNESLGYYKLEINLTNLTSDNLTGLLQNDLSWLQEYFFNEDYFKNGSAENKTATFQETSDGMALVVEHKETGLETFMGLTKEDATLLKEYAKDFKL